jgi:hypothetical protein
MNKDIILLLKFDIILAKSNKTSYYQYEIDDILNRISSNNNEKQYCLNLFIINNILLKEYDKYYYTYESTNKFNPFKNYKKIVSILEEDILKELDFSKIIL